MRHILNLIMLTISFGVSSSTFAGEVSRAMFTTAVEDREPVTVVDSISSSSYSSITFFTELNDFQGHNITHQWVFAGDIMFEKTIEVSGARWRVWTSKTFLPGWTGTWTVNVLDADRAVLASKTLEYQ